MGHWGLAHASGPYYNGPWNKIPLRTRPTVVETANAHVREAERLAAGASDVERALIAALVTRFPEDTCDDQGVFDSWDDAYADAMRVVYAQFGADQDVSALTVEALICRTPWQLWNLDARVPAEGADTAEALEILKMAFASMEEHGTKQHPGLLHFFVHIMEMSPTPEDALAASDTLGGLVPDAAHLIHMPSHIYILCGEYEKALQSNIRALVADDNYRREHPELGIHTIYRMHNLHFQIYSAMFLGQYERAIDAADRIWEVATPEALRFDHEFLATYLEAYYGTKVHVYIRFGRWQEIIKASMPEDPDLFVVTTALWHYAKGVAYAATGDVASAEAQQALFASAWARVPVERITFNNEARDILKVGEAMLAGEIAYRKENFDEAFAHLRRCVELYDQLNYSEPWGWMQPPRHALGALLLEQGYSGQASDVYRADLGLDDTLVRPSQHPGNIWSLHGYLECCQRLGRTEEAAAIERELTAAQTGIDIAVESSCFCRLAARDH